MGLKDVLQPKSKEELNFYFEKYRIFKKNYIKNKNIKREYYIQKKKNFLGLKFWVFLKVNRNIIIYSSEIDAKKVILKLVQSEIENSNQDKYIYPSVENMKEIQNENEPLGDNYEEGEEPSSPFDIAKEINERKWKLKKWHDYYKHSYDGKLLDSPFNI